MPPKKTFEDDDSSRFGGRCDRSLAGKYINTVTGWCSIPTQYLVSHFARHLVGKIVSSFAHLLIAKHSPGVVDGI